MRAIVTGMIATYPVGGVVWDYAQYALGLERLGFEVYYLEDTGGPTYDPRRGEYGEDASYGVQFLNDSLRQLSPKLRDRWFFRDMDGRSFGMDPVKLEALVRRADLFLNVSGGTLLRDPYMACPCKLLIESDPGWNHFVNFPKWDQNPDWQNSRGWRAHDYFFTFAERIGQEDCVLPTLGVQWHATRPLVVTDLWKPEPPGKKWTTVMTWNNFRRTIEHLGVTYGTKELEFPAVETLPSRTEVEFELAVGGANPPREHWRELGWAVVSSEAVSRTLDEYRAYIQGSRGEFSVAKNVYVATRSGWFSCRSVCYLAACRPVVVQDTGFSELIPSGHGLFAFSNVDEAQSAIEKVERDYADHQNAARELAREYFDAERVLNQMLVTVGLV